MSYLFISHDLDVVRHISHRVAVMYLGEIVEQGEAAQVTTDPQHPRRDDRRRLAAEMAGQSSYLATEAPTGTIRSVLR